MSLALCVAGASSAQTVYRVVDENGRVTFTDSPERGGEALELAPLPSATPDSPPARPRGRPGQPFMPYDHFSLQSPASGAVIDEPTTAVQLRVSPSLREDHQVRLLVNGEISQSALHSEAFWLPSLAQGTHRLQAELLDSSGRVQHRTEPVSIRVVTP